LNAGTHKRIRQKSTRSRDRGGMNGSIES
jgi:hypothetical protein